MDDALTIHTINLHPRPILTQIDVMHTQDFAAKPPPDISCGKLGIHFL
jgi:hypothetical protein